MLVSVILRCEQDLTHGIEGSCRDVSPSAQGVLLQHSTRHRSTTNKPLSLRRHYPHQVPGRSPDDFLSAPHGAPVRLQRPSYTRPCLVSCLRFGRTTPSNTICCPCYVNVSQWSLMHRHSCIDDMPIAVVLAGAPVCGTTELRRPWGTRDQSQPVMSCQFPQPVGAPRLIPTPQNLHMMRM